MLPRRDLPLLVLHFIISLLDTGVGLLDRNILSLGLRGDLLLLRLRTLFRASLGLALVLLGLGSSGDLDLGDLFTICSVKLGGGFLEVGLAKRLDVSEVYMIVLQKCAVGLQGLSREFENFRNFGLIEPLEFVVEVEGLELLGGEGGWFGRHCDGVGGVRVKGVMVGRLIGVCVGS